MKKIVGIIAAAALAASAFAEVTVGSWSRGAFVPVATDADGNVNAFEGANWDNDGDNKGNYAYGVRTGLGFKASSENAGVVFDVFGSGSGSGASLGVGDNAYVWVKPFDMLRVAFGKVDNNWGRTDVCFGNYDHAMRYRFLPNGEGIGAWRDHQGTGVNVTLQPTENIVIDYQGGFANAGERAYKTLWHNADLMLGYKADFGFIRAIVAPQTPASNRKGDSVEWMKIGLGADITAVENLTITAGVTIPTCFDGFTGVSVKKEYTADAWEIKKDGTVGLKEGAVPTESTDLSGVGFTGAITFGAGAHYNLDPIAIHGFVTAKMYPDTKEALISRAKDESYKIDTFGVAFAAGVDFNINDQLSVITDFRFMTDKYTATTKAGVEEAAWGAYAGLCQKLTNASFDVGVQLANQYNVCGTVKDGVAFAIPLMITTSF